ncbi:MAG: flagellar hook-associated protein FlgL [Synergistaceae bacterium]|nr:flagellar hook-associated protein FlgL [Synergistaceae bacterium]
MYSRLTTATMYGSLMDSLQKSQRNIQDLQQQIASGNKYSKLSDNPAAISRAQTVQSAMNANDQYQNNTSDALTMLRYADGALQNVLDAAKTIRNLIIEAGDAALDSSQLKDITAQIEANKKIMLDNLNTKVAGQYLFGGTSTGSAPFVEKSDGSIEYQGSDERIKYVLSESLLGDVSFAGSDIMPEDEDSYFICSHYVPLDWKWTGREEKVQITVGNRTIAVFIPEDWSDSDINKTNKHTDEYVDEENIQSLNFSDKNGFRDPNELSGISLDDLASIINSSLEEQGADMLVSAYVERDYDSGTQQLILKSNTGETVGITGWPDTDYMPMPATIKSLDLSKCEGWNDEGSKLTISTLDGSVTATTIEITEDDTPESIAGKINAIEGIYARHSADGNSIEIVAERVGDTPADRLRINEAEEARHYPSLVVKAEGGALKMFGEFVDDNGEITKDSVIVEHTVRNTDQSHIDIFDYLGMETATKSREFSPDEKLTVDEGTQLHWRVISGGRSVDIKLNSGEYTIDQLAERLKNAGAGWFEVTVEPGGHDVTEQTKINHSQDYEQETKRIVMRGYNGEQVIFLDMNEYNYADKLGVSTALRTDSYENGVGVGMKCVNYPSAPCVDDNVGVPVRVQMNCGMYYDVNIRRADVVDKSTGFVDRALLMKEIVDQVNDIEGHDIMGFAQHVDSTGKDIDGSCSMYFLSGEAFTVVDMPFDDPEWNDYSGGLAAQLGIHGGVSSNLKQTHVKMLDNATFAEAYAGNSDKYDDVESNPDDLEFRDGTIRFSNLAHSVEIDVSSDDTVKDVMDRLRVQAGDWLYVNYYDEHMGQDATRNTGDFPLISISSKDGSAVNVIDVKGHIAEDALGLSTGIQGRLNPDGTGEGIMAFEWDVNDQEYDGTDVSFPATAINITVAGYTHTLDLTTIRDVTSDDKIKADDVVEFINARMQDYDVRAEINADNELVVYSPRGYSIKLDFLEDVNENFLGDVDSSKLRTSNAKLSSDLEQTTAQMKKDKTFGEVFGTSFRDSVVKFSTSSNSVEIDVKSTDKVSDVMNRIKTSASWLNVTYDESGDYPVISVSSNNGKPLSVIDMRGHVAEDALGISTGIQGRLNSDGTGEGAMGLEWDVENKKFPAEQVNITVGGETHAIDLTKISSFTGDDDITTDDVIDFINDKLKDYDVRAEINADKEIVIYSPGGSSLQVSFLNNVNKDFISDEDFVLGRTHYRGGYNLEGKAYYDGEEDPRGVDLEGEDLYDSGIHTQNATIRSGANTMRQNAFGTINDVIAAIESGNRDDLLNKMLPRVDDMINNILSVMAEDGALQARYNYNNERLVTESSIMTEDYDKLVKVDPADAISQLMVADYMYQANLAVIARLIQPSLLDFLG